MADERAGIVRRMAVGGKCRSYTLGEPICRDGFPTSAACASTRCHSCGSWAAERKLPFCMREDLGPQWLDDAGRPRLRRLAGDHHG